MFIFILGRRGASPALAVNADQKVSERHSEMCKIAPYETHEDEAYAERLSKTAIHPSRAGTGGAEVLLGVCCGPGAGAAALVVVAGVKDIVDDVASAMVGDAMAGSARSRRSSAPEDAEETSG
ncbi:hypothetical protein B0H14DRAFT_2567376 [Mycena olivaceomarginata]|nr:hypothetical protein B0H14DRAFT_2567376 [Mycena olivaceomarginata]